MTINLILLIIFSIIRYFVNVQIYRSEYNYYKYSDGVVFNKKQSDRRDEAVALYFLSLASFIWLKHKPENKKKVIVCHLMTFGSVVTAAILFLA